MKLPTAISQSLIQPTCATRMVNSSDITAFCLSWLVLVLLLILLWHTTFWLLFMNTSLGKWHKAIVPIRRISWLWNVSGSMVRHNCHGMTISCLWNGSGPMVQHYCYGDPIYIQPFTCSKFFLEWILNWNEWKRKTLSFSFILRPFQVFLCFALPCLLGFGLISEQKKKDFSMHF